MTDVLWQGLSAAAMAASALAGTSGVGTKQDPQGQPPPPVTGGGQQNPNYFNPQISLVTDFRSNLINSDRSADKRTFLKEAELGMAADVDPYIHAEAYIAFADEDGTKTAEVEEGFGRYNNLGHGISAKFGKIAAAIGRIERNHVDQLNWLDYPFVIQDFLGTEGMRAGGISLSYLFPGDRFSEVTFEGIDSDNGPLFSRAHSGSPTWVGHYRTFFDFGESASAQLGATYLTGPSAVGSKGQMYGADLVYKWHPGAQGKSAAFESEAYWGDPGTPGSKTAFGAFASLTYEIRPRLHLTGKYDYSEIPGSTDIHQSWSFGATLKVTEFHFWRAEFASIGSNFAPRHNVLNLQFQWVIGAHPAHKY